MKFANFSFSKFSESKKCYIEHTNLSFSVDLFASLKTFYIGVQVVKKVTEKAATRAAFSHNMFGFGNRLLCHRPCMHY